MNDQPLIQNKYKIIGKIGNGSYSNVYKAVHIEKQYYVAIKFDHDKVSKILLENEINIYLSLLKHKISNICNIKSFGIFNSHNYIVMELLAKSLNEYFLCDSFVADVDIIKNIFLKVCNVIRKMHEKGIYHRDIKPENFLLDKKGDVFIIDLGLSTYQKSIKPSKSIIGSNLFCSYNVHKPEYSYTEDDDIISIYYMFFYLLSNGDLPWGNLYITKKEVKNNMIYNLKKYTNFQDYYSNNATLKPFIYSYLNYIYNKTIKI
jgi:casein kinase 1 epsilon